MAEWAVILRGVPLCGWIVVIPSHFYFVIIPLRTDCRIFITEEIFTTRLAQVESYLDIMLEFTELWSATHSLTNDCRSRLHVWFHTPVAIEVIGTPEQDLDVLFVLIYSAFLKMINFLSLNLWDASFSLFWIKYVVYTCVYKDSDLYSGVIIHFWVWPYESFQF